MSDKIPHISVVVPTFNEEKYIGPCIAALKNQTYTDFEVVAIDKSTDSTPRLCKSAGWRVIPQVKPGISAARSEGFAQTRGEIIASTDADSAPSPRWLENIAAAFTDPGVVCVYGPTYFSNPKFSYRLLGHLNTLFLLINRAFKNDQTVGMNFAVRKSAYTQIGGYNTSLPTAEDVDVGYRIRKIGRVVFHPRVVVYTSERRLARQKLGFFTHHIANFIRMKLTGKASSDFVPIR
jgi:glycosyltransferase involved in cell wall biosynthesis